MLTGDSDSFPLATTRLLTMPSQPLVDDTIKEPPSGFLSILRSIGPGLIVAGSIVGSGELIATTKTGAESGFTLLWLILLGCVVKVFAQIEFGRYAITSGKTTLAALDEVPGPRIKGRGNWLVWYWLLMWLACISQLGGIVGAVGQSLAISMPITEQGRQYNQVADAQMLEMFSQHTRNRTPTVPSESKEDTSPILIKMEPMEALSPPPDAKIWACLVAVMTSVMLYRGRYGLIQTLSTILVGSFTLLTIGNLWMLQDQPSFQVQFSEFLSGLKFKLPEAIGSTRPIATALATFGIIGVGAAELISYPYWCLEKGYAKYAGKNDGSPEWRKRAAGWMRVMHVDAWGAMLVYTFATIAFYLLGAAILHRVGLNPEKDHLVRSLAVMYVPVFSSWASTVFLFGAFAVLYSTFFVANAGHARTFSDAMRLVGLIKSDEETRQKWIQRLSAIFPLLCVVIFLFYSEPAQLVLLSGVTQGVMLPMLAAAALFFRYKRSVEGLTPGAGWDFMLWTSTVAMLVTGGWTIYKVFV